MINLSDFIGEYSSSDQFMFLDPVIKDYAEPMLGFFCQQIKEETSFSTVHKALLKMANLDMPVTVRKSAPYLLKEFFEYLSSSGRLPTANNLVSDINKIEREYIEKIRDDGSVKGKTFAKNYTDVGRNDPCPCGSGKKFKKCCMEIL